MPHELVHWHKSRLFCCTKPANQLVANVWEPGNGLEVVPDALVEVVQSALSGHRFATTLVHSVRPTSWKPLPRRLNSNGQLSFCKSDSRVKIFELKSSSVYARKYSAPNQAWSGVTWPVISLVPFSKEILIRLGCFRPSLTNLSGTPLARHDVHQVYQLNWGVFCALTRSDIITICTFLSCKMHFFKCVSTNSSCWKSITANNYCNSEVRSSRRADRGLVLCIKSKR